MRWSVLAVSLSLVPLLPGQSTINTGRHRAVKAPPAGFTLIAHNSVASTTSTGTIPSTNCTGANFIAVVVSDIDAALGTVTSSPSNTFVKGTPAGTSPRATTIWWVYGPSVSSTMTFSYTGAFPSLYVQCWSGATGSTVDQHSEGATPSTQPGSITPTANNELIISSFYTEGALTAAIDSGFTISDQVPQGSSVGGAMAYLVQGTAAAVNPTWSVSLTNQSTGIASFK